MTIMRRGGRSDGRLDTYILTGEEEEEEEAVREEEAVGEEEAAGEEEEGDPFKLRTDRGH